MLDDQIRKRLGISTPLAAWSRQKKAILGMINEFSKSPVFAGVFCCYGLFDPDNYEIVMLHIVATVFVYIQRVQPTLLPSRRENTSWKNVSLRRLQVNFFYLGLSLVCSYLICCILLVE